MSLRSMLRRAFRRNPGSERLVILNPASRGGRAASVFQRMRGKLRDQLGSFELYVTTGPLDAEARAGRALRERSHAQILVAGGDGTINEVVNGYFDEHGRVLSDDIPLGVIDLGTGGDFHRTLRELNPGYSVAIAENTFRLVDCGEMQLPERGLRRFFVNIASIGMAAGVLKRQKSSRFSLGSASFYYHTLRTLAGYDPRTFQIRLRQPDGSRLQFEQKLFNLFVCNARYNGGGMYWAPTAELDDGIFEIVLIAKGGKVRLIAETGKIYRGEAGRIQGARLYRATEVELEAPDGEVPELDGEVYEAPRGISRYVFRVRHRVLPLLL